MKLKFCRKEKGEGVNSEKPTSCVSSARCKGAGREMTIEKRQQKEIEDL